MFERREEKDDSEITFDSEINEEDIPESTMFNRFVNWFRIGH